jgi:hypothetical protein
MHEHENYIPSKATYLTTVPNLEIIVFIVRSLGCDIPNDLLQRCLES